MIPEPSTSARSHGTAFLLAAAILSLAAWAGHFPAPSPRTIVPLPAPLRGHYGNQSGDPYFASALGNALREGSSIVLMGSSELTTVDHPSKPINFFNKELNWPLVAIGHAGNQSFSMHAQFLAANSDLQRARLVILLSPGWFVGKSGRGGTALSAFLEYQPSPSLYRIRERFLAGDPDATRVAEYLAEHRRELGMAQPITQWLMHKGSPWMGWADPLKRCWNEVIVAATEEEMLREPSYPPSAAPTVRSIPPGEWAVRYSRSAEEHAAQCTNNSVHVNDEFYAEHVNGDTRELEVLVHDENRELRDLHALLDHLKRSGADPLFILQPLNPFVYTNLKDLDPTMDSVRAALDQRSFAYLDMWSSDPKAFQPGVLTDVMHLGALGWYRIDSAMVAHFQ